MKKLNKMILPLMATATLTLAVGAVATYQANANETAYTIEQVTGEAGSFKMAVGASVKNDPNKDAAKSGLRYAVTLSESHYNGLLKSVENGTYDSVEFGVFVLPASYNDQYAVRDSVFCENEEDVAYNWAVKDGNGEWVYTPETGKVRITKLSGNAMTYNAKLDAYAFYGTVVGVLPENMGTEMLGVGYIAYTVEGETSYVFTAESEEATNVRTMAYVAQVAIDNGEANPDWLRETYITPVINAGTEYEYVTENYFENEDGNFVLDATKNTVESAALEADVTSKAQVFDGYFYDTDNVNNVASGKVVALNGATVLKRYYAKSETEEVTLAKVADVELSRSTVTTFDINIEEYESKGEVASVALVNGASETAIEQADYVVDGNVVKVNVSAIGAGNFGKDLTVKIVLAKTNAAGEITNYTAISQPFSTVSMVIRNADDLDAMQTIADGLMADGTSKMLNGYFVLGNNINYTEGNAERVYAALTDFKADAWCGFEGTFDGRGLNIDNFSVAGNNLNAAGLFACIGQYGTVKNVSFTNAVNETKFGFISSFLNGKIENVFVHYARSVNPATGLGWTSVGGTFSVRGNTGGAQIKNCMVIVDEFGGAYNTIFGGIADHGADIMNNVYAIGSDYAHTGTVPGIYDQGGSYGFANYKQGAYATVEDYLDAVTVVESEWDSSFWNVQNGIPMPKKLTFTTPEVTAPAGGKVFADETIEVSYSPVYQTVTVVGNASVEGGTVVVDSDAVAGDTIVITVTDVLTGESKQATYTVKETINVALAYVEMGNNATGIQKWVAYKTTVEGVVGYTYKSDYAYAANYVVDLTAYGLESVTKAMVGTVDVTATTSLEQFSFAKSAVSTRGEVMATVTGTKNGGEVQINMPLVLADILISTADDFEAMQWLADEYMEDTNTWCASTKSANMAGYIVLTNNITYNRTYRVHQNSAAFTADAGFAGILDGRGYKVEGIEMVEQPYATNSYPTNFGGFSNGASVTGAVWGAGSGIFATMYGGTIKNIAFTNAKHSCGGGFITSHMKKGNTIENVYIHLISAQGNDLSAVAAGNKQYAVSGLFNTRSHAAGVAIKNVFAKIDAVSADYYSVGCFYENTIGSGMQNVYIVTASSKVLISQTGVEATAHSGLTLYADTTAATAGKAAWAAGLTSSVWDTTGDLPVFASTKAN